MWRCDYLSARPGATDDDAQRLNRVIRTHGEIENRVPWVLAVAMGKLSTARGRARAPRISP